MSFVAVAIGGAALVSAGTAVYSANQQKKAARRQENALAAAREQDKQDKVEAVVGAEVASGEAIAAATRRKRTNALALGAGAPVGAADTSGAPSLLGSGSGGAPVLGSGGTK